MARWLRALGDSPQHSKSPLGRRLNTKVRIRVSTRGLRDTQVHHRVPTRLSPAVGVSEGDTSEDCAQTKKCASARAVSANPSPPPTSTSTHRRDSNEASR